MVDTHPQPNRPAVDVVFAKVAQRINRGDLDITDPWSLPEMVTALVTELMTEHTTDLCEENTALREQLAAEQDAANDAINELLQQLDEARADREAPARRVYESGEDFLARMEELRPELERGA